MMATLVTITGTEFSRKPYTTKAAQPKLFTKRRFLMFFITKETSTKADAK